jgi:hypothetical protein
MSQENIEIVRQVIAAYSGAGEIRDDLIDPAIEVWESPELRASSRERTLQESSGDVATASSRVRRSAPGAS